MSEFDIYSIPKALAATFSVDDIKDLRVKFGKIDTDRDGYILSEELLPLLHNVGEQVTQTDIQRAIVTLSENKPAIEGKISFTEFTFITECLRRKAVNKSMQQLMNSRGQGGTKNIEGMLGAKHTFSDDEKVKYCHRGLHIASVINSFLNSFS